MGHRYVLGGASDLGRQRIIERIYSLRTGNTTYTESTDHYILSADEDGIKNAVLTIESAVMEDRNFYNCTGTNDAIRYGNSGYIVAVESTYVRVKGMSRWRSPDGPPI